MKELELYDIYGTWHVPFWQRPIFIYSLIGLVSLLIVLSIWLLYKKYKKVSAISIAQQVLQKLEAVKVSAINTKEDAQKAYSIITDSLKTYFQYYYNKPFKTFSDFQMQSMLASISDFPLEWHEPLKKVLEDSVQVKFAREFALQQQVRDHANLSINIINQLEKARTSS